MLVAMDCFMHLQARGLKERMEAQPAGDSTDVLLGLKWSWDEATVRMFVPNSELLQRLMISMGVPEECIRSMDSKRPSMAYSVIQQRGTCRINGEVIPIYVPARVVENTTASCLFSAVDSAVPQLCCSNLDKIASTGLWVYLGLMGDAVGANRLTQAGMAYFTRNALVADDVCLWHQMHLSHQGSCKTKNIAGQCQQRKQTKTKCDLVSTPQGSCGESCHRAILIVNVSLTLRDLFLIKPPP